MLKLKLTHSIMLQVTENKLTRLAILEALLSLSSTEASRTSTRLLAEI